MNVRLRLADGSSRFVTAIREEDRNSYLLDENGNDFLPALTNPSAPYSNLLVKSYSGDFLDLPQVKP
jgi:hypothetical protein